MRSEECVVRSGLLKDSGSEKATVCCPHKVRGARFVDGRLGVSNRSGRLCLRFWGSLLFCGTHLRIQC